MELRVIHYKDGLWTFVFEDDAQIQTRERVLAEYVAGLSGVPTNKYGRRVTSYIDPLAGCDLP